MTVSAPPCSLNRLENHIRALMDDGLVLTEDVRRFMEGTFGAADVETLQTVLADPDNSERDSLLDLLFFPDQSLQAAIEPLLEAQPLSTADVGRLAQRFKATPLAARFRLPGTDRAIPVALPASGVDAFVIRLNLAWAPAAALAAALSRLDAGLLAPGGSAEDGRIRLRVRLRNAALTQTAVQVRFLCDFLERMPLGDEAFVDHLQFSLVFLQEHPDAGNLYAALMDRKRFICRHLQKSWRAAERAARSNMETLAMTGVRTPYFDVARGERDLEMIDRIALAVFGRTEMGEGLPREVDLGDQAGRLDPAELIRRLS